MVCSKDMAISKVCVLSAHSGYIIGWREEPQRSSRTNRSTLSLRQVLQEGRTGESIFQKNLSAVKGLASLCKVVMVDLRSKGELGIN